MAKDTGKALLPSFDKFIRDLRATWADLPWVKKRVPAKLDYTPLCPTVMHYGDSDHIVPVADIESIRAAHGAATIHIYPGAGHAFFNPEQRSHDADAAALAYSRSIDFLDRSFAAVSGG